MKQSHINVLQKSKLFKNFNTKDIQKILDNSKLQIQSFEKGEFVVLQHRPLKKFGILLDGNCQIIKEDIEGNRMIFDTLGAGNFFGEAIVLSSFNISPVSIIVKKNTTILWFEKDFLFKNYNTFDIKLIENIMTVLANKNYILNNKINILSKRSIREKLLAYFHFEVQKNNSNHFVLPFTKSDLAEYICVERTAMYRVLKNLCDEGIISIDKRKITILHLTKD